MAVVLVVLITAICLMTFLFASMTMTLTSRSSAEQERTSTQALLAADSGLRTLYARTADQNSQYVPYSSTSYGSLQNWLDTYFGSLNLGSGVAASIQVLHVNYDPSGVAQSVTVQSTGTVTAGGNTRATRVVVQRFKVTHGTTPAAVHVPGALTSVGAIKSNSSQPRILGRENTLADWTYSNSQLCLAQNGEYVQGTINGITGVFKVTSDPDCSGNMTVTLVDPLTGSSAGSAGISVPGDTSVTLRPTAITEPMTIGADGESQVTVTDGTRTLFGVGSSITIGDSSTSGTPSDGTVTAINGNTLTIDWSTPPATQSCNGTMCVPEGTVVRSKILSGVTSDQCEIGTWADTTFPNQCQSGTDLSNLFYKTFGVTPDEMKTSSSTTLLTGSDITTSNVLSGVTWVTNPDNNFRYQNGSGILIIENNPGQTITLNVDPCPDSTTTTACFNGLIYVIGDADIQGNADYQGAIIVDGTANVTDVQGTPTIDYDPLQMMRSLAGLSFPDPNPGGLGHPIADTWRVR